MVPAFSFCQLAPWTPNGPRSLEKSRERGEEPLEARMLLTGVGREGSASSVRRGSLLQTVQGRAELRVGFGDSRIGSYSQV
jgi:hypothetical protein